MSQLMKKNKIGRWHFILLFFLNLNGEAQTKAKVFEEYKNNPAGSVLPDFSYAGYHNGEKEIPQVMGKIFDVTAFGARPDDDISDRKAIEKSIAAATKNGGGIILFPKGRFLINEDEDEKVPIKINCSHIVFRGAGAGEKGTELFMKNKLPPRNPEQMWTTPAMIQFSGNNKEEKTGIITAPAATGSFELTVDKTGNLKAGDWIILEMTSTDPAVLKYDLENLKTDDTWTNILEKGVNVKTVQQVARVEKNKIILTSPVIYPVNPADNWQVTLYGNSTEVGIENIAFTGNWSKPFKHHGSAEDDSGWFLVQMSRSTNSWIRDCRFTDANISLRISGGANISVINCTITGNPGHEAIHNEGGTNIFFGRLTDHAGMWHSVGVNAHAVNTVLYKVSFPSTTCFESHSSQPRNTLLDGVTGGLMNGRAGGSLNNMPNHLAGLVFWNYNQTNPGQENFDFWPSVKVTQWWRIPYPVIVGYHGANTTFVEEHLKYIESPGSPVTPASLYEAQMKLRLGKLPEWLVKLSSRK